MDLSFYNSYYEINLKEIQNNVKKIKNYIGNTEIMPVLKSDAYGMGSIKVAELLRDKLGVKIFACAQISEGMELRNAGFNEEILVMGPAPTHTIPYAVRYDLQIPLFTHEGVILLNNEAEKQGKRAKAQIKIETGMNRIGVKEGNELKKLLKVISKCTNIEIMGAYTHFANADIKDDKFTKEQYRLFKKALNQIEDEGICLKYRHCCNTSATEWFHEAVENSTHIRLGSLLLGYSDIEDKSNPIGVKESLSWRSFITNIKMVYPGEGVSYGHFFKPLKPTKIATVCVGFGDGLFNPLAKNEGPVLVGDILTKYLDTCMDQCFIDVTGIDCKIGDEVTLFGYSKNKVLLSPKKFAKYGQIYTAHTCASSKRVKKIYI